MKAGSLEGPKLRASLSGSAGTWSAVFNLEGANPAVQGGAAAMRYLSFPAIEDSLFFEFARAMESIARQLLPAAATFPSPSLVDSFSPGDLLGADLPIPASSLSPFALAGRAEGSLVVACGPAVIELDRRWLVSAMPGKRLTEENNYSYAYGLAITPAGTL